MKLKAKFISTVSILVATLVLTVLFAFSDYKKSIKEMIAQQQFVMISTLADEIDSKLLTAQQNLISITKVTPPDLMQNSEKAQAFLDNRPILHTIFDDNVSLITPSGKMFVESPYIPGRRGSDVYYREFVSNTLKTGKPYISDPFVSSRPPKHPAVIFTVPLFDNKGKIKGILGGSIDLMKDNFLGRLSTVRIGETGYLILTAVDRTLIMHPDKKRIMTKQAPGVNRLYDKAIEGFEGTGENITSYGTKMVSSYKRLKVKNWILIAAYPQAAAYRPIQVAARYFLMIAIIGIVALSFSIFLITKYFIKPIELFTRHVEDIPQKKANDRFLNIKTKDEIGTLSQAFNEMVTEIDKRSELEHSEIRLRTVLKTIPDLIWLKDLDGVYLSCNEMFERFFGAKEADIVGRTDYDFIDRELADSFWESDHKVMATGKPISNEKWLTFAEDGYKGLFEATKTPMHDDKGKLIGVLGIAHDMTERKKAESDLREIAEKFRNLFNNSEVGMFRSRLEGSEILDMNQKFLDIVGMTREEVQGKPAMIFWADPKERGEMIRRLISDGRVAKFEYKLLNKLGVIRYCLASAVLYPEQGILEGSIIDITELKKLEEQLRQSQKMEAIGTLAGGVAHDFNNILMAIIGFATMAQSRIKDDEKTKEFMGEILASANRAAELTQGLLAFSRKQTISLKQVDLNAIAKRMHAMIGRILGEDIELKTILLNGSLPVLVDESQIQQVLLNLVTNARDAMPDGGELTIQTGIFDAESSNAEAHLSENTGMYAVMSVSDTGIGMDQKTRENIFEPFFTTKEVGRGTGLGLAMVYGIVKQHGGDIDVNSQTGKGTTFRIYLPMISKTAEEDKEAAQPAPLGSGEMILLAEDDPQVRKVTSMCLQEFGYKVIEAENGEDATKRFIENKDTIAIVLLDVIMPVKTGKDAYEEIKKLSPDVKAIFMSGYTDDIISRKGILEEGFDFISKPINPDTLMRKIRDVLDR
jgi:PAS domain S-box-containing protein